jgi:hypothetical protein
MPPPFPEPSINSTIGVIQYANAVTNSWMTTLFVICCAVILFLLTHSKGYRVSDSFLVSFMLTFLLSSMLFAVGLLAGKIVVILILLVAASALYSAFDN